MNNPNFYFISVCVFIQFCSTFVELFHLLDFYHHWFIHHDRFGEFFRFASFHCFYSFLTISYENEFFTSFWLSSWFLQIFSYLLSLFLDETFASFLCDLFHFLKKPVDRKIIVAMEVSPQVQVEKGSNLIINYLPNDLSDEQFHDMFSKIGPIYSAKVRHLNEAGLWYIEIFILILTLFISVDVLFLFRFTKFWIEQK